MGVHAVLRNAFPGAEIGYRTREGLVDSYRPYIEQGAIRVF